MVDPKKLKFNPKNVKIHEEKQLHDLGVLFEWVGFAYPIFADKKTNMVWAGNGRLKEALEKGMEEVSVIYLPEDWSLKRKQSFMLMDNKITDSDYNFENFKTAFEAVSPQLEELFQADFSELIDAANKELKILKPEQEKVPAPPKEPETKLGDIYQLGRHKLICGDALTDIEKIIKLTDVNFIFTDPPYNIGFNYHGHKDKMSDEEYFDFCRAWYGVIHEIPKIIITPGPRNLGMWDRIDSGVTDIGMWREPNSHSGATVFNFRTCEPILFYGKFDKKRGTDYFEHLASFTKDLTSALKEAGTQDNYPPSKPLTFVSDVLHSFSNEKDKVLDMFLGAGTTLIACEATNRTCYGVEKDPAYCDVTVKRWQNFTGLKAKLL